MLTTLVLLLAASPPPPDTVVVCPREFIAALKPWLVHREAQGHVVEILPNRRSPQELRQAIRESAQGGALRNLLLIGDADPRSARDPAVAQRSTPTFAAAAKVNVKWGSEPEIGTDNWYADLDDDDVPELAVGRLTADSRAELAQMIQKIISYEQSVNFGPWRRRINFVAGVGGFGAVADSVIETTTRKFLTEGIPSAFETSMTYGSWRSAYCPDPRKFHQTALDRFNEGCLFWVYIGHGHPTGLDQIRVPGRAYHILGSDDVPKIDSGGCPPIAVFLSCYAGAFDQPNDCLGEELLRAPSGAVAVLCGSRVTMPYAMAVLGSELMDNYFGAECQTLGEAMLRTKRKMAEAAPTAAAGAENPNRLLLDALARAISPDADSLDEERREHLLLFNLLGDPLLKLPRPERVDLELPTHIRAGDRIPIVFHSRVPGECRLELVCRRDRLKEAPPQREYYDGRDRILTSYDESYRKANDDLWTEQLVVCEGGRCEVVLDVPLEARGNCHVRAFVQGERDYAVGSADVFVRKPLMAAE